jgi:dihydropteroate synthase
VAKLAFPFSWGTRTYVMGILNVTPDSFSGDGLIVREQGAPADQPKDGAAGIEMVDNPAALAVARQMVAAGADILDVGGESTRPGAQPVGTEVEIARVVPLIQSLSAELDVLISIDTYKAAVARAALEAGADLVNDVWGLKADPDLAAVVAQCHVPVILMHNRSSWANAEVRARLGGRYIGMPYQDLIGDIQRELLESIDLAHAAGIPDEHILLDPGIGFGKTVEQNLELLDRLGAFRALGYPLLVGPSRKSFIGYTLDLPPDQRLEGTAAAVAIAIARGADIIRVHDVGFMVKVARMTDAMVRRPVVSK